MISVMPAKAGIQRARAERHMLDFRLRGNDGFIRLNCYGLTKISPRMHLRTSMFVPTPPPAGSTIEWIDDGSDVCLRLREATMHPGRKLFIGLGILGLLLFLMTVPMILLIPEPMNAVQPPMPAKFVFAIVFGVNALLFAILFGPLLRRRSPESITFSFDTLVHDTGSPQLPLLATLFLGMFVTQIGALMRADVPPMFWSRRKRSLSRDAVSNIHLEHVGERQRLTIDHGADRIEIGPALREPEREWLAEVLRVWQGEED